MAESEFQLDHDLIVHSGNLGQYLSLNNDVMHNQVSRKENIYSI